MGALAKTANQFFAQSNVQAKFQELMGKRGTSFVTSVLQIVNSNKLLAGADPASIYSAACMAATLDLPINNTLGFAYIVPYKRSFKRLAANGRPEKDQFGKDIWDSVIEAQFQLGYKGFVQLAIRSGQFKRISATAVHDGQIVSADPLMGYQFDWSITGGKVIGYVAYFELLNGFQAFHYMTEAEIKQHATKYSQSFKDGRGVWKDNFDAMAQKTVLKLLLSKQAPLSVDMQTAIQADQAIIKDVDTGDFEHVDNEPQIQQVTYDLSHDADLFAQVMTNIQSGQLDKVAVLSGEAGYSYSDEQRAQIAAL